jgi:hypothetical protein
MSGEYSRVAADNRPGSSPDGPGQPGGPLSVSARRAPEPAPDAPAGSPIALFSWTDGTGDCEELLPLLPDPAAETGEPCGLTGLSSFPVLAAWLPAGDPAVLPEDPGEPVTKESED